MSQKFVVFFWSWKEFFLFFAFSDSFTKFRSFLENVYILDIFEEFCYYHFLEFQNLLLL